MHQQPVGLHHHLGVAGLHAQDDLVEVLVAADAQELEGALHHALGRVAVAVQDAVAEAAVVGADAHGGAVLLADAHQRGEAFTDALQLGGVLGIAVGAHVELLLVGVVAGVHPHLFHEARGDLGGVGGEVDVGHQRSVEARGTDALADLGEVLGLLAAGRGDADQLTPRLDHPDALGHGGVGVHRVRGGHALHPDRVVAPDADAPDAHGTRPPPPVGGQAGRVGPGSERGGGHPATKLPRNTSGRGKVLAVRSPES